MATCRSGRSRLPSSKPDPTFLAAEVAFDAKRFSEAINLMTESVRSQPRITKDQRAKLSQCYHRAIARPREAVRLVNSQLATYEHHAGSGNIVAHFRAVKKDLELEIQTLCNSLIELIDMTLLPVCDDAQATAFFLKLKADYTRYLAELNPSDETGISRTKAAYEAAMNAVGNELRTADPVFLGLVLNFSVFQYEMLDMKDEAIERAESSYSEATRYLDELEEKEYAEATMVLALMRDNIAIWKEEKEELENAK